MTRLEYIRERERKIRQEEKNIERENSKIRKRNKLWMSTSDRVAFSILCFAFVSYVTEQQKALSFGQMEILQHVYSCAVPKKIILM